jgi:thioredoxin
MENLTKETFQEKVFNFEKNKDWKFEGDKPCIIDFYADWCQPCKMVAPVLEELSKEYEGKINIYKVNTEIEQELAGAFGIKSIPSMLFCPMKGQPQMAQGALPKHNLEEIIKDVWERYYIVPAKELFELDFCVVDVIRDNEINCNFDVSGSISPNQPYIFKFNQRELGASIIDAHTQLKVSVKLKDMKKSFFILMSNVKKDLASKYGEYLF